MYKNLKDDNWNNFEFSSFHPYNKKLKSKNKKFNLIDKFFKGELINTQGNTINLHDENTDNSSISSNINDIYNSLEKQDEDDIYDNETNETDETDETLNTTNINNDYKTIDTYNTSLIPKKQKNKHKTDYNDIIYENIMLKKINSYLNEKYNNYNYLKYFILFLLFVICIILLINYINNKNNKMIEQIKNELQQTLTNIH